MDGAWSCLELNSEALLEEQSEAAGVAIPRGLLEVDEQHWLVGGAGEEKEGGLLGGERRTVALGERAALLRVSWTGEAVESVRTEWVGTMAANNIL